MVESFRSLRKLFRRFQIAESISKYYVTTKRTKDTKDSRNYYISNFLLRALRDFRGEMSVSLSVLA